MDLEAQKHRARGFGVEVNHGARGHTTKIILWGSRSSIVISRRHKGEATTNTTSQTSTLVGANLCLLIPKPKSLVTATFHNAPFDSSKQMGVLLSSTLLRTVDNQSAAEPPPAEGGEGPGPTRLAGEHLADFVMDVLVKGEWQELPLGATIGSVVHMNRPSHNRLRVRIDKCEDSRRCERQAREMQLLRERAFPANKTTTSPVPLRKVLVAVPVRVNHDGRYYMLLNVNICPPECNTNACL